MSLAVNKITQWCWRPLSSLWCFCPFVYRYYADTYFEHSLHSAAWECMDSKPISALYRLITYVRTGSLQYMPKKDPHKVLPYSKHPASSYDVISNQGLVICRYGAQSKMELIPTLSTTLVMLCLPSFRVLSPSVNLMLISGHSHQCSWLWGVNVVAITTLKPWGTRVALHGQQAGERDVKNSTSGGMPALECLT